MSEGHTTLWRRCPRDGDGPLAPRAWQTGIVRCALDQLLPMDKACTRNFGPDTAPCLSSDALGSDPPDDKLMPYSDEADGDDRDFADAPVDLRVDVRASLD